MTLPAEFSLNGQTAIVASAGGDETPRLAAALAEAGATVFAVGAPRRGDGCHPRRRYRR